MNLLEPWEKEYPRRCGGIGRPLSTGGSAGYTHWRLSWPAHNEDRVYSDLGDTETVTRAVRA